MSQTSPASTTTFNADACVGIVVALPEELATLTSIKLKQGDCCQIGTHWVAYAGAGFQNAATAAQLLADQGAQCLISWGCAAGLAADVKPGELLLPSQIDSGAQQFDTDSQWSASLCETLPNSIRIHTGKLYSSDRLISSSQEKQRIHQQTGATALDMESAAIAEVALRANLPFMAVRSIADPVGQTLPNAVIQALNNQGLVELPKLLRYLFWHPVEIKALIQLGLHFHAAQKTLKLVAGGLIKHIRYYPEPAN
ncbi:hopanoid-associated phosphorylase [Methylomonas methanica]|uniref:Hopanoid-associated phosphorylase n=1 Tax=Methylomonas methanica (strain DSM 25384 / MC09) TaxID=857087 RepID=G0A748_METMM|nr:hopanoid-associated phosphorylase [Methylomonas methanica]AEG01842.1 hopanoid-associated phosphorylase [Methylomonas methanica MC09]